MTRVRVLLVGCAALLAIVWLAPPHYGFEGLAGYLPLHTLLETVSIVIAALVFGVVWNAHAKERDGGLVALACAFVAVAIIDFVHTLSYPGMPEFVTSASAQKSIFFWMAARFVSALALFAFALWPLAPLESARTRYGMLAGSLAVAAFVSWLGLFHLDALPALFVEGQGLTALKVAGEYALVFAFALAAVLLRRRAPVLAAAAALSALSELSFTLYATVTDVFTVIGHVYKGAAYLLIYRAVFVASVQQPFRAAADRAWKLARAEHIARVGSWEVDLPANRLTYSDEALRIHGLAREQFDGTLAGAIALAHPDDRGRLTAAINATLYEGTAFAIDYRILRPDGSVRYVHVEDEVERSAAGSPLRAFGITQDITERKLAEEVLRESKDRYRSLVSAMAEGIVMQEASGAIVACNESAERILGLTREQMLGVSSLDPRWQAIHEDGAPFPGETHPAMRTLQTGVAQTDVRMGIRKPDGTLTWISINSQPLKRPSEAEPYAVVTTFHDITERKRAEQALREERQRLGLLTDNVPAMIAYVDAGQRYRYANLRYREFYAGSDAPVEGKSLAEVLTAPTWALARPGVERALAGETVSFTAERVSRDGSTRHVSISLVPHRDDGGVLGLYILALDVTAEHNAGMALRESEAGLRHAQEMAGLAHVVVRPDGSYERWSQGWPRLLGREAARLPRSTREALELVHPQDRERFRAIAIEAGRARLRTVLEYRLLGGDGAFVSVHQVMEPIGEPGADGRSYWFVTLQDVTEQKRAEARIRRLNRVYRLLSGINGAIVRLRDRQELFEEACRIAIESGGFRMAWIGLVDREAGLVRPAAWAGEGARTFLDAASLAIMETGPDRHGLAGRAVRERKPMISNDVAGDPQRLMRSELAERGINSLAVMPLAVGGETAGVLALYAVEKGFFDDEEMRLMLELAGDIAFALDHIENEERVRYLAYYDSLTGLANRTLFLERLGQQIAAAAREGRKLGLLIININRFKTINDTLGRQAGDALLREFGRRLAAAAGEASLVARVGADQFAVMLTEVQSEERLIARLEKGDARVKATPFATGGTELHIATRSGVALFPQDAADADNLFRNAEAALKRAQTGEMYLFYRQEMTERVAEKLTLENRLRRALEMKEFVLHYQPKLDLASRRITGVEALIRWASPELGLVPPAKFIPLLEETGLILPVGAWAMAKAVEDHQRWQRLGLPPVRIAVNVSAIQLRHRDFVARLGEALAAGAAPPGIDLELTESLLMEDVAATVEKLKAVRELGVEVAIDDFGTGYSSLSYLTRLPVQALKVDRAFVAAMAENPDAMTLVTTIVSLARSLRLKVVAEGVETQMQESLLRGLRCDEAQGYLYAKPLPAAELEALLAESPSRRS
jgi:diguanylate cyclase (GGDEF)-like protein/PAS domain S-box-containing protein